MLKCLFAMQTKKNLPIFDIDEVNLRNWTTTERDAKRHISKFPPAEYRNYHEDLLPRDPQLSQQSSSSSKSSVANSEEKKAAEVTKGMEKLDVN